MGPTEEAAAKAQANPHPPGTLVAAAWDLDHALQDLFAPFLDWWLARTVGQYVFGMATCFVILAVLSVAAGSPVPLALGIIVSLGTSLMARRSL